MQREIDESLRQRDLKAKADEVNQAGIENLVAEEQADGSGFVNDESTPRAARAPSSNPSENPLLGASDFVVNIKQYAGAQGQEPCPSDRSYYNPGDECKPYKQQLYKPLCYYELNDCLELMKKFKMKTDEGDLNH